MIKAKVARCIYTIILILVANTFLSSTAFGQDNRVYTMGIHFASGAGVSSAQGYEVAKSLLNVLTNKHGYKVRLEKYGSWDEVQEAFADGKLDAAYLKTTHITDLIDNGMTIRPWASFIVEGRPKEAFCLWHKNSEAKLAISDVPGKSSIFYELNPLNLVKLRDFLAQNGIDKPLWQVFSSFLTVPNQNSAFMALAMGDGDFFWTGDDGDNFLELMNKNVAVQLEHDICTKREYARGTIVFNGAKVSEKQVELFRTALKDIIKNFNEYTKEYQDLQALKAYMKLSKITFSPSGPDEFDGEIKLYKKAKTKGWLDETAFLIEKLKDAPAGKPTTIKPDYKMCKSMCDSSADPMKCVDKCME